ncbi:hypothetical protein HGP28_02750 [Vibrio sp. SM6]|uniref:Pilus assembly protein E-set like domain-containing protein n=1 Tax=Vibrio agarilyticus TaxID=2726741 RepID=A0A7X8TN48_9VIBR|nr:TcfC E-set like domain-containing protein [Vibrio agarilyticus]NLS11808.1 hypothetical protein [Vibrio agarilyticus]
MKKITKILASLSLGYMAAATSNEIPEEFADLFVESEHQVEITIAGDKKGHTVDAIVTYDTFKLLDVDAIKSDFRTYLKKKNIKEQYIDIVVNQLLSGVESDSDCVSTDDACIPQNSSDLVSYYYDHDNKNLIMYASSEAFDFTRTLKEYHSSYQERNALVNNTNLYIYANDDNSSFIWSNDTTLGLTRGHVQLDTQYHHGDNELDASNARYNYAWSNYNFSVGYSDELADQRINSTDFLFYGTQARGYSALFSSSDKLLVKDGYSQQFVNFYSPQEGQLEVLRNGKLLFTDIARQGHNRISYSELPQGVYAVTLKVKQADNVILEETIQVVNKNNVSLAIDDYDFVLKGGLLELDPLYRDTIEYNTDNKWFTEAAVTYRASEKSVIGGVLGSDFNSLRLAFGGQYYLNEDVTLDYLTSQSSAGAKYYQGNLIYGPIVFSASDYKASGVDYTYRYVPFQLPSASTYEMDYSDALYGIYDKKEYSIGYSTKIFEGRGYANLYHAEVQLDDDVMKSNNLSLSWDRTMFGGIFGINATYNLNSGESDSFTTNFSWRYEFDDTYSARTAVAMDQDGFSFAQQELTARKVADDYSVTTTVATKMESYGADPWTNELLVSASGSNDYLQYNGFGYVSTGEQYSVSGTLRGTQIVTNDEFVATKNDGKAFIKVTPQWSSIPTEDAAIAYSIYKDGEARHTGEVGAKSAFITSLPVYSDVTVDLDTEYTDVEVDVSSIEHFTMPGTYLKVNSRVTPLRSQVFILNDIDGQYVENVSCVGDGCKSVEPVTEGGIYRVVYRENDSFHLASGDSTCVFNPEKFGNKYVQSYCLEGLTQTSQDLSLNTSHEEKTVYDGLKYMGVYQSTEVTLKILERLKELGIASRYVQIDDQLYVYVEQHDTHSIAQVAVLEELNDHVTHAHFKPENMFSVTKL